MILTKIRNLTRSNSSNINIFLSLFLSHIIVQHETKIIFIVRSKYRYSINGCYKMFKFLKLENYSILLKDSRVYFLLMTLRSVNA